MTMRTTGISRRRLLASTAVTLAGATALAGCSGSGDDGGSDGQGGEQKPDGTSAQTSASPAPSATGSAKGSAKTPLPVPDTLTEAPSVTAAVKAGDLPELADRLPADPYVVPHKWAERGTYGGVMRMSVTDTADVGIYEYFYGYSFLRYLNDGQDIGPGLARAWTVNADSTELTFHFRKGLKWSDGEPCTTADVMYWWNDMVRDPDHPAGPPDDVRDGKDHVAKVTAPDDYTLKLEFTNPAPAAVERIAAWVNGANGENGPVWIVPRHYIKRFHPKYNPKVDADSNWPNKHDRMLLWMQNPDCPTLAGWHVTKFDTGQSITLNRNPFYYAVTAHGDQLPYIDTVEVVCTQDPEVQKLQFGEGKVDYVEGCLTTLTLADVSTLKQSEQQGNIVIETRETGSGSASVTFFNLEPQDKQLAELLAEHDFRRALSYAYNRPDAKHAIYLQQGELTTGTLSPKGQSFQINAEAKKLYAEWRDSYKTYDKAKAGKLLDKLGLRDSDGDGFREFPDGHPLTIRLDRPANASQEHVKKCNHLKRDWEAVGLKTQLNPVPPTAFGDEWGRGALMTFNADEVGDNSPLVYPNWIVPVQNNYWAPLTGQGYTMRIFDPKGMRKQVAEISDPYKRKPPFMVESDGWPLAKTFAKLQDIFDQARVEPDAAKRMQLIWKIIRIHVDEGPFFYGVVANYPAIAIRHPDLHNIPAHENLALGGWTNPWIIPTPAVYDPELAFWSNPDEHTG